MSRQLVQACYEVVNHFPADEKYALSQQIRRAAISVQLNIAEGSSRKSDLERKRFYEIARGSVIEIDAALDAVVDLNYCLPDDLEKIGSALINCFKVLTGLINSITAQKQPI